MVYTTYHIDQILSSGYCCVGTIGDKINVKLLGGMDYSCDEHKLQILFMYIFALEAWSQSDDGKTIYTTTYTVDQRDKMLESIINTCGCFNVATAPVLPVNNDYWTNGYTENDEGSNSYNG